MKKIYFFLIALIVSLTMNAGEVTEQEALQKAQQFMQGKQFKQKSLRRAAAIGGNSFYIFNAEQNGGFVIVSADDRTKPILGYADQGNFDVNKLPENTRKWLEGYEYQIGSLGILPVPQIANSQVIGEAIEPLVTAKWNQGSPENNQCPIVNGEKCVTGCVATAMAQVMYFHKWPQTAVEPIKSYSHESGLNVPEIPATTFKWDKMRDRYPDIDETGENVDAVAELMRYCGQAVKMFYTPSGSTCYHNNWAEPMIKYFSYSKTAQDVERYQYTTKEWESIIYQELKEHRPVLYSGNNELGGHAFVIDGYDGKGLFHVNWGFSGEGDGFFVLSVLNAFDYGVGNTEENGYTMDQHALIGLQPDHGEQGNPPHVLNQTNTFLETYTRTGTEDFKIDIQGEFFCSSDINIDVCWVLIQDGTIIKEFEPQTDITLKGSELSYISTTLSFGASLTDGDYGLRAMYRINSNDSWRYCDYYYGSSFLLLTINGTELTATEASKVKNACQVNSVELNGRRKTLRGMTASVNWTNKGYNSFNNFFLWDGGSDPILQVSSYLDHNETEDLQIHFVPRVSGTFTYQISTDYMKENVIWSSEPQVIEESLPQHLSGEITVAGEKEGAIESTTINADILLKNDGENTYDDNIRIDLFDEDAYMITTETIRKEIALQPGEQETIPVQFADLKKGNHYYIGVCYYNLNAFNDKVIPIYAIYHKILVGKEPTVEITPITETEETSFSEKISADTDLEDAVIDNTYYNVKAENGDGYDATEQALVLNSTTSSTQMTAIQNAEVGDAAVRENFNGIIFEIPAGEGTITLDAKTIGTHVLNVQIGNGAPTKVQKSERGTVDVPYNVTAPTYVYLYASTESGSGARLYRSAAAGANSVLLYGYKVTIGGTGIGIVTFDKPVDVYNLQGQKVRTNATSLNGLTKGVYIINGQKVVVK